jgi:large subunit ribosomal protein L30
MENKMANQRTDSKAGGVVKVTLLKSPIGFNRNQATVVRGLGLRRIRHTVELKDTPATRGMIHKVRHLVEVE